MRYRVEYLTETTDVGTVCIAIEAACDRVAAEWLARARGADARRRYNAEGFQIRDLSDAGRIVTLEWFDAPLGRLRTGDEVIH